MGLLIRTIGMINIANNMKRLIFHQERQQLRICALHRLKPHKTNDNLLKPTKTDSKQVTEHLLMSVMGMLCDNYKQMVKARLALRMPAARCFEKLRMWQRHNNLFLISANVFNHLLNNILTQRNVRLLDAQTSRRLLLHLDLHGLLIALH